MATDFVTFTSSEGDLNGFEVVHELNLSGTRSGYTNKSIGPVRVLYTAYHTDQGDDGPLFEAQLSAEDAIRLGRMLIDHGTKAQVLEVAFRPNTEEHRMRFTDQ